MAYELDFPEDSRVHNVFHVSHLKKALGRDLVPSLVLPPLDDKRRFELSLEVILDSRERQLQRTI